ncbi:hypothetical protein D3C72_2494640 [compost metagenome]
MGVYRWAGTIQAEPSIFPSLSTCDSATKPSGLLPLLTNWWVWVMVSAVTNVGARLSYTPSFFIASTAAAP